MYGTKFAEIVPPGAYQHLFVGFGLVIVAGVFSVVSGILFVLAGSREQSSPGVIMNMNTTK